MRLLCFDLASLCTHHGKPQLGWTQADRSSDSVKEACHLKTGTNRRGQKFPPVLFLRLLTQGVDVEAFHWSAMNFNRHWRQRVAVALGRGQALIISRAAERAHRRRRTQLGKHSREHSPYDSW